jgi:glycosyltransferase involved in cell wall biosynthesis
LAATNSRAGKEDLVARDFLPADRIAHIYNGVDLSRFAPEAVARGRFRAEMGIPEDHRLIVSISRYVPRKGQEYELEGLGRLVSRRLDAQVVFIGPCRDREQPYKQKLMARAVGFPGAGPLHFIEERADIPEVLADADVLVRAALIEGLPNCALEAMAMRVPVVATGICGTPEAVLDGETGVLVPPAEASAIDRAVERLVFGKTDEERRAMGERGRAHVQENFALDRMVDEYEKLFERAVEGRDH